jgi:hypothetical protein
MDELEQILALFVAALLLAGAARRVGAPYPVFLAIGGALLAFVPGVPSPTLPPELVLAVFVAPVLLDAAYDASLRDLRDNWMPVAGLVVFAVGLTTVAVAVVARALVPGMPWAAAIALGAIVAPPDAVAATAVLRPLRPPQRILTILEGESLLNDASALLIYRLAVGAVAAGSFSARDVGPAFVLAVLGSLVAVSRIRSRIGNRAGSASASAAARVTIPQGLTLKLLLRHLALRDGDPVAAEVRTARRRILDAVLSTVPAGGSPATELVRKDFKMRLMDTDGAAGVSGPLASTHATSYLNALHSGRSALLAMRSSGEIGDDAFHTLENELDWMEVSDPLRGANADATASAGEQA